MAQPKAGRKPKPFRHLAAIKTVETLKEALAFINETKSQSFSNGLMLARKRGDTAPKVLYVLSIDD